MIAENVEKLILLSGKVIIFGVEEKDKINKKEKRNAYIYRERNKEKNLFLILITV